MNDALERLAREVALDEPTGERLRLAFGYACALRVKHLLEEPAVVECLSGLGQFLDGTMGRHQLAALAERSLRLATQHQGSKSIDGCGHAAVSATYAVAHAIAGRARQAAEYAAYAMVYAQGGHGAVADRPSFEPEFQWQVARLASLAHQAPRT